MDALQVIKEDNDAIRKLLAELVGCTKATDRRRVFESLQKVFEDRLVLEDGYIYPEIHGLFAEADVFVTLGGGNHKLLRKQLTALKGLITKPVASVSAASLAKKVSELEVLTERHLETIEQVLMPKMRQLIPTGDREDLGQVFSEVKADLRAGTLPLRNTRKVADKTKKRA